MNVWEWIILGAYIAIQMYLLILWFLHITIVIVIPFKAKARWPNPLPQPKWYYGDQQHLIKFFLNGNWLSISKTFRLLKVFWRGE